MTEKKKEQKHHTEIFLIVAENPKSKSGSSKLKKGYRADTIHCFM